MLQTHRVDGVVMAEFGTVVSLGRVLDSHPALLSAVKGWHAVWNTDNGMKVTRHDHPRHR